MDLSTASLNSVTIRQADLTTVLDLAVEHGFGHVALWRDVYADAGAAKGKQELDARGLGLTSVCRAGMFPQADDEARLKVLDDNRAAIDEAHTLGAECLVLVCGGPIAGDLPGARSQIRDGIATLAPIAKAAGVQLAVEPMHPMMAADRSAITSLGEANDLIEQFDRDVVGIALDSYHVWWDVRLEAEVARTAERILGVQVSDWILPIHDQLSSRGMPGTGCIDLDGFLRLVGDQGYARPIEVEVLSANCWRRQPADVVAEAARRMSDLYQIPAR